MSPETEVCPECAALVPSGLFEKHQKWHTGLRPLVRAKAEINVRIKKRIARDWWHNLYREFFQPAAGSFPEMVMTRRCFRMRERDADALIQWASKIPGWPASGPQPVVLERLDSRPTSK